jgi:glycerophosphoryl diester phosphodiesterase
MPLRPLVRIAHGGGGSLAAPNSLDGIERSLSYGLEMIEIDVRGTADGRAVLSHDDVVGGTSIGASPFDAVRRAKPDLATLDDALDLVGTKTTLNLDIKDSASMTRALAVVRAHGALDRCVVSCLDRQWLASLAELEPTMQAFLSYPADRGGASQKAWLKPAVSGAVSLMRMTLPRRLPGMVRALQGAGVTIYHPLVTPRLIALARSMRMPLYTWTVDDPEQMRRLVAMGVDGITSNRPDLLAELAPSGATEAAPRVR